MPPVPYGGTVITAAGTDDRVAGLVYIATLAPDESETSQSQQSKFPVIDVFSHIEVADGRVWMLPEGVECFAGDLSEQEQEVVWATMLRWPQTCSTKRWSRRREVEAELVHCGQERPHRATRAATLRCQAYGLQHLQDDSSHVPMLSQPKFVIEVIRTTTKAIQNA